MIKEVIFGNLSTVLYKFNSILRRGIKLNISHLHEIHKG